MKNLKYSPAARITAGILFIFFFASTLGFLLSIAYIAKEGGYSNGEYSFYDSNQCSRITRSYTDMVYYDYLNLYLKRDVLLSSGQKQLKYYEKMFSPENTNFMFSVTDADGKVILSNYKASESNTLLIWRSNNPTGWIDSRSGRFYEPDDLVKSYVKEITAKDDYHLPYNVFSTLYSMRYVIIFGAVLSAVFALLLFIFLMQAAGMKKDVEGVALRACDKIPFDLYALGFFLIWLLCINVSVRTPGRDTLWNIIGFIGFCALAALTAFFGLLICTSFSARVKAGKWWQNTVIYRFPIWLVKVLNGIVSNLPLLWKCVVIFLAYLFVNGLFVIRLCNNGSSFTVFLGFLFNLAALLGICYLILQMNRLKLYAEKIALGNYEPKIDTSKLLWDIKSHGETLNNIGSGMLIAVDERIKSERLKAELITNVSHDIKTPLTSIISYVDLLKKENIENDKAREYLDILDRQSAKLKKLTVDLVDASKASTGNIELNLERIDIAEFLNQSVGEYSERFAAAGLEVLVASPSEKAYIHADGRLLWRVFDNLLNNVCKYAMPNTRVYIDVENGTKATAIALKNISHCALNITPDELMERFVRGDRSRTTDGSGLGLSIAKSLTELMKGSFDLLVDGDLFKVTVKFDSLN